MPILPPLPRPQLHRIHKIIHATRGKSMLGAARSTIGCWLRWYRDEGVGL